MNFPSVRLEGSIVTADVLDAVAREDKPSQKPADFGLDSSARVKDEIASTWASAKALWTGYQAKITNLREGQTGVSETRNLFALPFLALLGYQPEKADAETINAKSYAISHRDPSRDGFPLHIMGWNDSLEKKRTTGGPRVSPHALVQEYLNLTEHLYGVITNGHQLRLLRDSSRLIKLSFLEFDLVRIFEEDLYSDFALLFRLLHATRMPANRANASASVIEKYHQDSVDSGSRIRDGLAAAVAYAMQTVANGLLAHSANGSLVEQLRTDPSRADELHQNLLRWVYRTLFVLVIEERVLHHAPEATLRQRQLYRDYYSLQRLRRLADRPQLADRRAHDLWRAMHQTLRLYEDGGKGFPLGIAPLGSFLFREEGLQALFQYQLDNRSFLQALNRLSTFNHPDTNVRMRVNYAALDVEEFGSVYESLLELRPRIIPEGDKLKFHYAQLAGNERKTSGSYYTPDSLVQCLLDSALDPVVEARLAGKSGPEAEAALLSIKVCDPAVGSGHFLIGAAHRLAQRLADIRAGEEALSPDVQRHALRDVVSRCLYGVDVNPLSGELCKVSLWMLAMEPGKPLGFLDHHIQCGNSLLGVTPRLLDEGLPDAAFKPLTGDDPAICKEAKKRNKEERKQLALFHGTETKPWERLGNLPAAMLELDAMSDETTLDLHRKEERYAELVRGASYKSARFLADAWCAAFVWKKTRDIGYPITNDVLRKIERNPHDCVLWMREEIKRLCDRYQFFHWHLAFPDVFPLPAKGDPPENKDAGWNRGFDVMLGNPPWDRLKLDTTEWFQPHAPEIATEGDSDVRDALIDQLRTTNPDLFEEFESAKRNFEGTSSLLRDSGFLRRGTKGEADLSTAFAELGSILVSKRGRVGLVTSGTTLTGKSSVPLLNHWTGNSQLLFAWEFINSKRLFKIHSSQRFALLTLTAPGQSERTGVAFDLTEATEIPPPNDAIYYTDEEIHLLSPTTHQFPKLGEKHTKDLLVRLARAGIPLSTSESDPFGFTTTFIFEEAKSRKFFSSDPGPNRVSVLEGKSFHQFDHRFANYELCTSSEVEAKNPRETVQASLKNPFYFASTAPRLYADGVETAKRHGAKCRRPFVFAAREVSNSTNEYTVIACVLPAVAILHSAWVFDFITLDTKKACWLLANFNSFAFNFAARQKVTTSHLSKYVWEQLPVVDSRRQESVTLDFVCDRVLELTYTAWDLEPFARDSGWFGPPFVWHEARRFQLRCELDAAFLHLYALSRADAAYILDTFPIVRRKDIAATEVRGADGKIIREGTYRTRDVILALYDQFAEASTSGKAFVSPLDPPPGDIRACHPPRAESPQNQSTYAII